MNGKAVGLILVFFLVSTVAPACGTSAGYTGPLEQEYALATGSTTETAGFTLDVYYKGTVYVGCLIDGSYRQFSDLVQGHESYDLGEGRDVKVTVYKGGSKFYIDYRKVTALLFADGEQVAGGTSRDKSGTITLAYELK